MQRIIHIIERAIDRIGTFFSLSIVLLVLVICIDVFMRYLLGRSFIWVTEIETYLFAIGILFGLSYALRHEAHVRVDLFYARYSEKGRARVDLIGALFFLIPFCLIAIHVCYQYAVASWRIGESSAQAGGLQAVYVLKFILVIGFALLFLQGIAQLLRAIRTLMSRPRLDHD